MNCPKCNAEIPDNAITCPNCKKVLKLVCPKCQTVNKTNTCKKCGFVIVSKCHQCGKINQTIKGKCSKCGFSTYTSVAINSSNIDEFACLTVEFPNIEEMRSVMGSTKLTEKFKANLDNMIKEFSGDIGTSREIIEGLYIIRFNKDSSFEDSCQSAAKGALEILKLIANLNFKLEKAKNFLLQCKIAILKRDINSQPEDYKSGFDIRLIGDNKKEFKYLNCFQIITDQSINEQIASEYDLNSLSSALIKGQMVMFFEMNLKKHLKIEKPKEEEKPNQLALAKLNNIEEIPIDEEDEAEKKLYGEDSINFNNLKCSFINTTALELPTILLNTLKSKPKNIISVRGKRQYHLPTSTIPSYLAQSKIFKSVQIVTCYDEMKYTPYGFFYQLIAGLNNYKLSPRNFAKNDFSQLKELDSSGFIKSLINLEEREFPHPEDVRFSLFDIFLTIFEKLGNTLIYVENFEQIDDTSYEILQMIFEKYDKLGTSFIINSDSKFLLHKKNHFLLSSDFYTEIKLKPVSVKNIMEKAGKRYEQLAGSHYFMAIMQGAKGSYMFFKNAIEHLLEKEILEENGEVLVLNNTSNNALIPQKLSELIIKRLQHLKTENESAFHLLSMVLLFGPIIDIGTIQLFNVPDGVNAFKFLSEKDFIFGLNSNLYVKNYLLFRKALLRLLTQEEQQAIATEILQKICIPTTKHPIETDLNKILESERKEFLAWEQLAKINASMGDFSAYLNCSIKLLKLLDNNIDENSEKTIDEYKLEVYENISNLLYKYTPNEIYNISNTILKNLEKTVDNKQIINMCNKMLQSCLIGGNYSYALELVNKILSKFPNASINPKDENFKSAMFLITMIKIEVLFSVGKLKECEETGEAVLDAISQDTISALKPEHFNDKQFEETILDSMTFVTLAKIILLKTTEQIKEFTNKIQTNVGSLPEHFNLITELTNVIRGIPSTFDENSAQEIDNKFYKIILNLIKAFKNKDIDAQKFANDIYQAKINAKVNNLAQIELICDLLIGYSYFKLEKIEKASSIYYNVLELSKNNGLKLVMYISWYLITLLKFKQNETDIALGIANNAVIQIERDENTTDYVFYLFRILTADIYTSIKDEQSAISCLLSAKFINTKYNVEYGKEKFENLDDRRERLERRNQDDPYSDFGGKREGQRRNLVQDAEENTMDETINSTPETEENEQ